MDEIQQEKKVTMVPVGEFEWGEIGPLRELTCRNHDTARYLTKNPWLRGLHFIRADDGFGPFTECPCPFSDMVVLVESEE